MTVGDDRQPSVRSHLITSLSAVYSVRGEGLHPALTNFTHHTTPHHTTPSYSNMNLGLQTRVDHGNHAACRRPEPEEPPPKQA
jgi:hypothetical protein